jgi:DNA-binding transcriptional ArsR family regulator
MSMIASAPDGEVCVCELTPAFDLSGPTISHHLKTLRESGLVNAQRWGTWVYYRPRPDILRQLASLLTVKTPPRDFNPARRAGTVDHQPYQGRGRRGRSAARKAPTFGEGAADLTQE